jgi:hypothetical protein
MKTYQKTVDKITKAKFATTWSTIMISRGGDWFHQQIQASYHARPLGYKGVNLGFGIETQQIAS